MSRDRDVQDVLRVLETFNEEKVRQYMSKQHLEQLFQGRFKPDNLKRILRNLTEKKQVECIEYGDFTDYRVRITPLGQSLLQGKVKAKTAGVPLRRKLLWIVLGVIIYGLVHCIFIRLAH